jgi:hypothetical protein
MNIRSMDLVQFVDDGQRAYRLKKSIGDCPKFDIEAYRQAWRAGFFSARDRVSVAAATRTLLKELDEDRKINCRTHFSYENFI